MAEFCTGGLWDLSEDESETFLSKYLPETDEVKRLNEDLHDWCDKYTGSSWHEQPSPNFDWDEFHQEGIELAKKVKKLMGPNGIVIYHKIIDYPLTEEPKEEIIIV